MDNGENGMSAPLTSAAEPLGEYWNALVRGAIPPRGDLDPELANTVLHLHALSTAPGLPPRQQAQIWAQVLASLPKPLAPETAVPVSNPRTSPNGHGAWISAPPLDAFPSRRHWSLPHLGTAALLLLTLGLIYVGFIARLYASRVVPGEEVISPASISATGVPMFRANPAHTGQMPGPGPSGPPRLRWRFAMPGGPIMSSPVVADGVVYAGNVGGAFFAIDALTGEALWQTPSLGRAPATWAPAGTAAVSGDLVYVANHGLHAFERKTGEERWQFAAGPQALAAPTVVDGVVYFGSDDRTLYALDAATGAEHWHFVTRGTIAAPPAVVDGVAYLHGGGGLYAIDTDTGKELWHTVLGAAGSLAANPLAPAGSRPEDPLANSELGSVNMSAPAVANGVVYVGAANGTVYAIDAQTGAGRWHVEAGNEITGSPAVVDGTVYIGSSDNYLHALDAASGAQRWRFDLVDSLQFSSPAVVGGTVYIGSNDGNLYAVDAATGQERWHFALGSSSGSSPAVIGGTVFIGADNGYLYAIGGTPSGTPSP